MSFKPQGSVMSMKNRLAMIRWLHRNQPETLLQAKYLPLITSIRLGVATRPEVMGFHPTKGPRVPARKQKAA